MSNSFPTSVFSYAFLWIRILLLASMGLGVIVPNIGVAAVRTVTNLDDQGPGSLRQAIADSADGDTINFAVTGAIGLTSGELVITNNISLLGPGAAHLAVNGIGTYRVFNITSGVVSISDLTVTNGYARGFDGHGGPTGIPGAVGRGGAIHNAGTLTLAYCSFFGNRAVGGNGGDSVADGSVGAAGGDGEGGGIYNEGTLTLTSSTFFDNNAFGGTGGKGAPGTPRGSRGGLGGQGTGGAICNPGRLSAANCTFNSNIAVGGEGGTGGDGTSLPGVGGDGGFGFGGTLNQGDSAVLTLVSCTMNDSFAAGGDGGPPGMGTGIGQYGLSVYGQGGGINVPLSAGGSTMVQNTIIAGNTAKVGPDVNGFVLSQGHNLIGEKDDSGGWQSSDLTGSTSAPLDPVLGFLQNNGGQTQTQALLPGSPAIDAGASGGTTTDQRGAPRPNDNPAIPNASGGDGSDIGAYEVGLRLTTSTLGGGVVCKSPDQSFYTYNNTTVTLTPIAASGWVFSHWSGDGSGANNPLTVVMTNDKSITANFTSTIPDIIVDNTQATFTGDWYTGTGNSCYGPDYRYIPAYPPLSGVATFTPTISVAGNYDVDVWLPIVNNLTPYEFVTVAFDGGTNTFPVYYTLTSPFGAWGRLPLAFRFAQGTSGSVSMYGYYTDPVGFAVYADAVRFAWSADQGALPCLKIISISKAGSSATLTWLSETGRTYHLQYKTNLSATSWSNLSGDVTATNTTATKTDGTLDTAKQRFYRVMLLP